MDNLQLISTLALTVLTVYAPSNAQSTSSVSGNAANPQLLRYEDDHLRLLEVTYLPGEQYDMPEGSPYPAVVALGAPQPRMEHIPLASNEVLHDDGFGIGPAPAGMSLPRCLTMGAQPPFRVKNIGNSPAHFYRIEFKRIDGEDFRTRWAEWYPYLKERHTAAEWFEKTGHKPFGQAEVTQPPPGSPTERTLNPDGYPYPDSYDSVRISPGQHWPRYEDANVPFIEVMYRPGERGDATHGHPYPSVFAKDSVRGHSKNEFMDPASNLNGQGSGNGSAPAGADYPTCSTMAPQAPHRPQNVDTIPMHFYRIEFKHLDQEK